MCVSASVCTSVWASSVGLSVLVALYDLARLDGRRTDVGARHFKKQMSKTFRSESDACVVCRRSSRDMNK